MAQEVTKLCRICGKRPEVNKKHLCQPCTNAVAARAREARAARRRGEQPPKQAVRRRGRQLARAVDDLPEAIPAPPAGASPAAARAELTVRERQAAELAASFGLAEQDRERHLIALELKDLATEARRAEEYDVARKCIVDRARVYAILSTGGNTLNMNFGDGKRSDKIDAAIDAWLERNAIVEGEVVEG